MGKRRDHDDSDDDYASDKDEAAYSASQDEHSEEEEQQKPAKKSRSRSTSAMNDKKPRSGERTAKKPRLNSEDEDGDSPVKTDADGRKYIDLGKKKRATLSEFKGTLYLDIREYYGAEGEEKPGKKGISINQEQWNVLRGNSATIDHLFSRAVGSRKKK